MDNDGWTRIQVKQFTSWVNKRFSESLVRIDRPEQIRIILLQVLMEQNYEVRMDRYKRIEIALLQTLQKEKMAQQKEKMTQKHNTKKEDNRIRMDRYKQNYRQIQQKLKREQNNKMCCKKAKLPKSQQRLQIAHRK